MGGGVSIEGSIDIETRDDVVVVRLVGEHDILTADDVRDALEVPARVGNGVVVSLMHTEFLDSGIVNTLFRADRKLGEHDRGIILHVATASIVARVLTISGLNKRLRCTHSLDEAVTWARRSREDQSAI